MCDAVSACFGDRVYVTVTAWGGQRGVSLGQCACVRATAMVCPRRAAPVSGEGARVSRPPAREQRRCALIGCGLASEKLANPAVTW